MASDKTQGANDRSRKDDRDGDRKGKGKAKDQNESGDEDQDQQGQGQKQQMKEIRRPPPLPAVKGTIGAIESPSRRSFFSGSLTTARGNHSRGPSYDTNLHFKTPDSPSPQSNQQQSNQALHQSQSQIRRERPVFRSDPTLGSCFDRLKLAKKDEIRSLFGA